MKSYFQVIKSSVFVYLDDNSVKITREQLIQAIVDSLHITYGSINIKVADGKFVHVSLQSDYKREETTMKALEQAYF